MSKKDGKISYPEIVEFIEELCSEEGLSFQERVSKMISTIGDLDVSELSYYLETVGSIPEQYNHDSSEEKLYAKYSDFLIFEFFKSVGMDARLCNERGDYADVIGKTKDYVVVADAKAFRLSRTALNPKDYKIEALNSWRKKANGQYACLVAPINEFPKGASRLYRECVNYNVCILSYSHLEFILSCKNYQDFDLSKLWNVAKLFEECRVVGGKEYWKAIENKLLEITGREEDEWKRFKKLAKLHILDNIQGQINYLNERVEIIKGMDEEKVRDLLLEKMGIKQKLAQIERKKRILEQDLPAE